MKLFRTHNIYIYKQYNNFTLMILLCYNWYCLTICERSYFFIYRGSLYRGIVPVLESLCTSNFVYFYTFNGLRYLRSSESRSAAGDLLFASIAGIVNVLTTTPLWVVNTRMKMEGVKSNLNRKYKNLLGK